MGYTTSNSIGYNPWFPSTVQHMVSRGISLLNLDLTQARRASLFPPLMLGDPPSFEWKLNRSTLSLHWRPSPSPSPSSMPARAFPLSLMWIGKRDLINCIFSFNRYFPAQTFFSISMSYRDAYTVHESFTTFVLSLLEKWELRTKSMQ